MTLAHRTAHALAVALASHRIYGEPRLDPEIGRRVDWTIPRSWGMERARLFAASVHEAVADIREELYEVLATWQPAEVLTRAERAAEVEALARDVEWVLGVLG